MSEHLTNLLPRDKKNAIGRLYGIRLSAIALVLIAFLILSATALRIPSYIYQYQQIQIQTENLARLTSNLDSTEGKEVSARFKAVNENIAYLSRLATSSSAIAATAAVLQIAHPGVIISALSYTPSSRTTDGKMTLSGKALTRESLRQYVEVLGNQSYIKNADLPISSYAKESDIPFVITLTGTLSL